MGGVQVDRMEKVVGVSGVMSPTGYSRDGSNLGDESGILIAGEK